MSLTKTIVKAAIMSLTLAAWKVVGEPVWKAYVEGQGAAVGAGELALGYFAMILCSWGISALITRRMEP